MAEILISVPSVAARSSAIVTRSRRRALSACRPSSIAWVGLRGDAALVGWLLVVAVTW
jgi:hypothetical protein